MMAGVGAGLAGLPAGRGVCDQLVAMLGAENAEGTASPSSPIRLDPLDRDRSSAACSPRDPTELRELRAATARLADRAADWRPDARVQLLLAVGEACANAIEHAYLGSEPGEVSVEIEEDAERSLVVVVRDFGRLRQPWKSTDRGRGTAIMSQLVDETQPRLHPDGDRLCGSAFRCPVSQSPREPRKLDLDQRRSAADGRLILLPPRERSTSRTLSLCSSGSKMPWRGTPTSRSTSPPSNTSIARLEK